MTDDEALADARRRWGGRAKVRHDTNRASGGSRPYAVGYRDRSVFIVCGNGDSWEEAFQNADKRKSGGGGDPSPAPSPRDPDVS
jgi:hypothetical protein